MQSTDRIKEAIDLAWASVEASDLPRDIGDDYHLVIFTEVLRRALDGEQAPAPGTGLMQAVATASAPADTALARLATRLMVPADALADVFAIEDGDVTLHVASTRIAATKSKATRDIALLVTGARQGTDIDESWTHVSHIRDALTQYSRYDTSNFSKYLRETGDVFNFRGKPVQQLRLTRPGWEAATQLVKSLIAPT